MGGEREKELDQTNGESLLSGDLEELVAIFSTINLSIVGTVHSPNFRLRGFLNTVLAFHRCMLELINNWFL
jgi:hypothetical protein